jgi:trimeric autotransporter adhesin
MKKTYLLLLPVVLLFGSLAKAQSGNINTVAGDGIAGYAGDGVAATNAKFDTIGYIAVDDSGNIYIADAQNNRIRKVYKQTGIMATIAGNGIPNWTGDYGLAVNAELYYPFGIAVDDSLPANIYFSDNGNGIVRKITGSTGVIHTIAGNGIGGFTGDDSAATNATFEDPTGVAVDHTGNVYIADDITNTVRVVSRADNNIYLYAGNGHPGFSGNGGPATAAQLNRPEGVAFDNNTGNLYIAEDSNFIVRVVYSSGMINTFAGIQGNNAATFANGSATSIPISQPTDVACDSYGNVFVSDVGTDVVRVIQVSDNFEIVSAGDAVDGFSGDGGSALLAELNYPLSVCVDPSGNVYVGDLLNFRIREYNSLVLAVPQISASGNLEIYPNPTTSSLNIVFPVTYHSGNNTIELVDVTGRTITTFDKDAEPGTTMPVDVSAFSTGMYFVKVTDNTNRTSQVFKFIKE